MLGHVERYTYDLRPSRMVRLKTSEDSASFPKRVRVAIAADENMKCENILYVAIR